MAEVTYTERLIVTHCWCGIAVGIPENLHRHAHDAKGVTVYCPLGHGFGWSNNFEAQLKREQQRHEATRDLLTAEQRAHSNTRGQVTKLKKRVAAGVCPCCHRSFQNLARHMAGQHPEYVGA